MASPAKRARRSSGSSNAPSEAVGSASTSVVYPLTQIKDLSESSPTCRLQGRVQHESIRYTTGQNGINKMNFEIEDGTGIFPVALLGQQVSTLGGAMPYTHAVDVHGIKVQRYKAAGASAAVKSGTLIPEGKVLTLEEKEDTLLFPIDDLGPPAPDGTRPWCGTKLLSETLSMSDGQSCNLHICVVREPSEVKRVKGRRVRDVCVRDEDNRSRVIGLWGECCDVGMQPGDFWLLKGVKTYKGRLSIIPVRPSSV